jgi:hypothetical protein
MWGAEGPSGDLFLYNGALIFEGTQDGNCFMSIIGRQKILRLFLDFGKICGLMCLRVLVIHSQPQVSAT